MSKKRGYDIKCDTCGKFIAHSQLEIGGGASSSFVPDSEYTIEEFLFRCRKCTEDNGKVLSFQPGVTSDKLSKIH